MIELISIRLLFFLVTLFTTFYLVRGGAQFSNGEIKRIINKLSFTSFAALLASFFLILEESLGSGSVPQFYLVFLVLGLFAAMYASYSVYCLGKKLNFSGKVRRVMWGVMVDSTWKFFKNLFGWMFNFSDVKKSKK